MAAGGYDAANGGLRITKVSLVCGNGAYASEYREIKDHDSCLWLNLEDLTAKLEEMCGPYFEGELPTYEL